MEAQEGISVFFGRTRIVILILANLCLTFAFSNSLALNFTVICMYDVIPPKDLNSTEVHWLESPSQTNALFSAIAIGCLIGTIPLSPLIQRFGFGPTASLYGFLSALATLLFPLGVSIGYPAVFVLRVFQGIATCLSYPSAVVATQWATNKGAGAFIAILSCHIQFCSIFTMPVAGALCESSLGWRALYYLQGTITLILFTAFYCFYNDEPNMHRKVSQRELSKIQLGKENQSKRRNVPYWSIIKDPCVLGVWSSTIGGTLGFQIFLLYGPTYMNKVLGLPVQSTGFVTALPYVLSAAMKFLVGPLSDKISFLSNRWKSVIAAALSQFVMAGCFFVLATTDNATVAQVAYTMSIVFSGVNVIGTIKCSAMHCRQFVSFTMSVVNYFLVLIVLLVPVAVSFVCPDHTAHQWAMLFIGVGVIVVVTNVPFAFVADTDPAPWTSDAAPQSATYTSDTICPTENTFADMPGRKQGMAKQDPY